MTLFKYKAVDKTNQTYEGSLEATDKFAVYQEVKKQDGTVISVSEVDGAKKSFWSFEVGFLSRIKTHDKIIFARNLGTMIDAGLSVTRALSVMGRQTKNKKLKKVLTNIETIISEGETLSEAMNKNSAVFSTLFISMVKAGEESGNVAEALKLVSDQMEKTYNIQRKVRGAMMYPIIIFSIMIIIGVLMMVYMVPTLTETFTGLNIKLPLPTRIIIGISDFVRFQGFWLLLGLIGAAVGIVFGARSQKGKRVIDWFILHVPIVSGIVKEVNAARTARTLSSLLSSGVDIVVAIKVTEDVLQNSYYKAVLSTAQTSIIKGENISSVFGANEKLYPVFVSEMISVGEETGKIGEMLLGVATFYEDSVEQKTKDMSTIIEPFLMVIIGTAVGFFAIAMLSPTYSLVDVI